MLLLSGGIESVTLLHRESRAGRVYPLFIDYAQRSGARELQAARAQCERLGLSLKMLDMATAGEGFRAGQEKRAHVPIPHRNLTLLSLALSYAAQQGLGRLCLALNREDRLAYPSAGPDFIEAFAALARTLEDIELATPLAHLSKAAIIAEGIELGVDYAQSYSCLLGYPKQCGRCPQCEKRRMAFTENALIDPAGFKHDAD